jgi:4-azaleucine resistance transporter AzlC
MADIDRRAVSRSDLLAGLRDIAPMMIAYAPIATLWGTVAAGTGLSPFQAWLMSVFVYSGAAQFVSMDLIKSGTPLVLLIFAIATVSLRHVLMSASVSRHISGIQRPRSLMLLFWLTDEAWALIERRALQQSISASYFAGVAIPLWLVWTTFCAIGAQLGTAMGDTSRYGLDFAFAAMFIAVLAGFWKGTRTALVLAVSAAVAVAAKVYIPGAWYIILGGVAGMLVAVAGHEEKTDQHVE